MQRLRFMPVQPEDLHGQAADAFVSALEEDQDGRTGAAQRAGQQARRTQAQDLVQPRHQGFPVGLVEAVFNRRREDRSRAGREGDDQQRVALRIEDSVLASVAGGQDGVAFTAQVGSASGSWVWQFPKRGGLGRRSWVRVRDRAVTLAGCAWSPVVSHGP